MLKRFLLLCYLFLIASPVKAQAPLYGTYFGTSGIQSNAGIVVNPVTNDYCFGGVTNSAGLPVANAFQATVGGSSDAYLTCIETNGTTLRFSTYIGGSSQDTGTKLAADSSGNLYLTGFTASTGFPHPGGVACPSGTNCAFLAKFTSTGTLTWATCIPGVTGTITHSNGLALDGSGNIWLTGYQAVGSGQKNAWVGEVSSGGTTLQNSVVLTGNADTVATSVAVSSTLEYIAGYSISTTGISTGGSYKPSCTTQCTETPPAGQCANVACGAGFIATFNTSLVQQAGTYLGGTTATGTPTIVGFMNAALDMEVITAIGLDASSPPHVYVTGTTDSSDFPTTAGVFQTTNIGTRGTNGTYGTAGCLGTYSGGINRAGTFPCSDVFISELNTSLTTLVASTMIGSNGMDIAYALVIDGSGNIWVSGSTQSNSTNSTQWPVSGNAFQPVGVSGLQLFVTEIAANLHGPLLYSSPFGNGPDTWGYGLSFTALGYPVIGGYSSAAGSACQGAGPGLPPTTSCAYGGATYTSPTTYQNALLGTDDAYIAVIPLSSNQAATPACTPVGGLYGGSISVTCTDSSSGAVMCYTTNGTTPATNGSSGCTTGTLYTGAISLSTTCTLQVIAGGTTYTDSPITSNTYTFGRLPGAPMLSWKPCSTKAPQGTFFALENK